MEYRGFTETGDASLHADASSLKKDINLSTEKKDGATLLLDAYRALYEKDFPYALAAVREARIIDVENQELRALDIALQRWKSILDEMKLLSDSEEKGNFLLDRWSVFSKQHGEHSMPVSGTSVLQTRSLEALQNFIVSLTQVCYRHALKEHPDKKHDPAFKLKVFKCLKMLGEYEKGLHIISSFSAKHPRDSYLWSQLADCQDLIGRVQTAKLFFREAFFWDPQQVKLDEIESRSIHNLALQVQNEGRYEQQYIREWIPVYGYVTKEFSVSRQLRPLEANNLFVEISEMEAKLDDQRALGKDNPYVILPRLLNRYFWALEHYKNSGAPHKTLEGVLGKIKHYDEYAYSKMQA